MSGKDADGINSAEDTETITVNKHGASFQTSYHHAPGEEIPLRTNKKDRVGAVYVVWVGKPSTPQDGLIGAEWLNARPSWGLVFPPDDWGVN